MGAVGVGTHDKEDHLVGVNGIETHIRLPLDLFKTL